MHGPLDWYSKLESSVFSPESCGILSHQDGLATLTAVKTIHIFSPMPIPKFTLRGFRRPCEVAAQALGKLEREVLNEIWCREEVSVRDVYLVFEERIAYTTLMTTLDRLFKKRLLTRHKDGRAFVYLPAVSRAEFEQGIREDVIDGLLGQGAEAVEPLLACIVDTVSERDRELLDELDRLIKEKRRELRQRS
jgi:predicted transcriptional regulator